MTADASATAYVAGYVARGSGLGQPSSRTDEDAVVETLWTRLRSVGGLTIPTEEFLREFRQTDKRFKAYHAGNQYGMSRQPGVIRRLIQALRRRHARLPANVVRRFVRVRTFIRLRRTNRRRKAPAQQKREQRKRKSFAN